MPLIACPDCNSKVSDQAPACPTCGRPLAVSTPPDPKAADLAPRAAPDSEGTKAAMRGRGPAQSQNRVESASKARRVQEGRPGRGLKIAVVLAVCFVVGFTGFVIRSANRDESALGAAKALEKAREVL